jgi:hypothetical protein
MEDVESMDQLIASGANLYKDIADNYFANPYTEPLSRCNTPCDYSGKKTKRKAKPMTGLFCLLVKIWVRQGCRERI